MAAGGRTRAWSGLGAAILKSGYLRKALQQNLMVEGNDRS